MVKSKTFLNTILSDYLINLFNEKMQMRKYFLQDHILCMWKKSNQITIVLNQTE